MKPYERRAAQAYPYYKIAVWNERNHCWNDGKRAYESVALAVRAAAKPGRYLVSRIDESGRTDLAPFEIAPPPAPVAVQA